MYPYQTKREIGCRHSQGRGRNDSYKSRDAVATGDPRDKSCPRRRSSALPRPGLGLWSPELWRNRLLLLEAIWFVVTHWKPEETNRPGESSEVNWNPYGTHCVLDAVIDTLYGIHCVLDAVIDALWSQSSRVGLDILRKRERSNFTRKGKFLQPVSEIRAVPPILSVKFFIYTGKVRQGGLKNLFQPWFCIVWNSMAKYEPKQKGVQ